MLQQLRLFITCIALPLTALSQDLGIIKGSVYSEGEPLERVTITLNNDLNTLSDAEGNYQFKALPAGKFRLRFHAVGYKQAYRTVSVDSAQEVITDVVLSKDELGLDEVVVSGTRYGVSRAKSPVVVNVLGKKLFNATQSMVLSESLNYTPGLRMETNCQNCGFTQVRMNGLEGAYSQILINSRPIFNALNGVYGLDQLPTSMIERVEVVRSGGSALYGSNAIAGTINLITKEPIENSWEIAGNTALFGGNAWDHTINFNANLVAEDLNSGVSFYGMHKERQPWDANNDGITEITKLNNTTFGAKAFLKPSELSKLTVDFSAINEFRRGGDRLELAPHFTDITEQLDHQILMGGLTYDLYSTDQRTKFSTYVSAQKTDRKSYYGGLGGGRDLEDSTAANNAYGNTQGLALVGGLQLDREFSAKSKIVTGMEYQYQNVDDQMPGYGRIVDQHVHSYALYGQYEWKPITHLTALLGGRYDYVMVNGAYSVDQIVRNVDLNTGVFSPRVSLLFDITHDLQLRGGYARGFRAPQAFDEDMHVSSVGGEPQFIIISEDLETEYSDAYTASLNYNREVGLVQVNVLAEGFYTYLRNPFTRVSTGAVLLNGSILEEVRNGSGAYVAGTNLEVSVSPSSRLSFQAGATFQTARYDEQQEIFAPEDGDEDPAIYVNRLMRTPNTYGFLNTHWQLTDSWMMDITGAYTGTMVAPHVVRESGFMDLVNTPEFFELNLKTGYRFSLNDHLNLELSGGVLNAFDSYQRDFDRGPERDSDYVYGPARPRTFFLSLKIGNLL